DLDAGAAPAAEPTGVSATRPAPAPEPARAPVPAPAPAIASDDDFAEPSAAEAAGVSATSSQAP
ncbi:dihydrolipoamide succinyltransferase, partial [Streptomyces sp. NPDC001833]